MISTSPFSGPSYPRRCRTCHAALVVSAAAAAVTLACASGASAEPTGTAAAPAALAGYVQKVSPLTPVATGTQVRVTVRCPAGTRVVGGGAYLEGNSTAQGLNTSAPLSDGRTWVVRVNNTDDGGSGGVGSFAQFRAYAVCVAGVRNYRVVEGVGVANPGGTQTSRAVACPAGTVPLGGGASPTAGTTSVYLNSSRPTPTGWRVAVNDSDPAGDDFVIPFVVCGQQPDGYRQVAGVTSTIKSGVQGQAAAACPAGLTVLAGGGQSDSTSQTIGQNSSAPGDNRTWQVFQNNNANVTSGLTAYAVCATATPA